MLWSKMTPWRNIWNVTSFETNYTQLTNYRCSNNILTTLTLWGPPPVLVFIYYNSSLSCVVVDTADNPTDPYIKFNLVLVGKIFETDFYKLQSVILSDDEEYYDGKPKRRNVW